MNSKNCGLCSTVKYRHTNVLKFNKSNSRTHDVKLTVSEAGICIVNVITPNPWKSAIRQCYYLYIGVATWGEIPPALNMF